jgi:DNA-binding transcriptional MerR regulator
VTLWTIDELAARAADLLVAGGVRVANARAAPVPDRRMIRWYATIGLLDRPLRTGGRTARYGERHLLQLIAVKRRQAEGRSLAEIQAELAGTSDTALRRIAALSELATIDPLPAGDPELTPAAPAGTTEAAAAMSAETEKPTAAQRRAATVTGTPGPTLHYCVPLHPAVSLTLTTPPTDDDLTAIHAAAKDLLHLLATRGLLR